MGGSRCIDVRATAPYMRGRRRQLPDPKSFNTRLVPLLALAGLVHAPLAAATAPPSGAEAAQAYVQGRLAVAADDLPAASQRFDVALQADADDQLQRRALDVAILSGDMKTAVKLANRIQLTDESQSRPGMGDGMVALTRAAGAAAQRDWRSYEAARQAFSAPGRTGESAQLLSVLLEAWGQAGRGDVTAALATLDRSTERGISASYIAEHRAHLLSIARRWPEAAEAYSAIVAAEGAGVARLRIAAAATALEASAKDPQWRTRAITLLGGGPARDPMLIEARARMAADPKIDGRKLGGLVTRPQEGLALMLLRFATDLARERALSPAISFSRLATLVEPGMPDAWLVTADTLARAGKADLALAALDPVPADAPWGLLAEIRRVGILASQDRFDEAGVIAARLSARPDAGPEDWTRVADIARQAGRNAEAAGHYARALALLPPEPGPVHAQIWFLRGSANELAGNWAEAEPDLRRAVTQEPQNPLYLNYLGYSLLDRRQKLPEARALIARAYKAAPENGAIIDSMGWAEFVAGNYPEAVQLLEKARAAEPADPTIADHLGDALWRAGRKFEARHAWTSAAALSPEAKLAALLGRKLDFGLDVALAGK
jgi:Flp pilus assembly protein TadD